jgi:hypothetical protein
VSGPVKVTELKKAADGFLKGKDIICIYINGILSLQVNKMSLGKAMKYKELYDKEKAKRGVGDAAFGKDQRVKATKYRAMKDDGRKRLHPAR